MSRDAALDQAGVDSGVTENAAATAGVGQNTTATTPPPMREGWALGRESWSFHRQFFVRIGRPMLFGEYHAILRQIRRGGTARRLAIVSRGGVYRVKLADGCQAIVRGGKKTLAAMLPPDWEPPPSPKLVIVAPEVPSRPAMVLRGTTLSLNSPMAARALATRLRGMGIPIRAASP